MKPYGAYGLTRLLASNMAWFPDTLVLFEVGGPDRWALRLEAVAPLGAVGGKRMEVGGKRAFEVEG